MSDEDPAIEPSPEPDPDESLFEIQPLDPQERRFDAVRETRDGD